MRHTPTPSESALWRCLSGKQLGVAFKRQQPIGKYIADFVAPSVKLIVEVDGGYHAARAPLIAAVTGISHAWSIGCCGCRLMLC